MKLVTYPNDKLRQVCSKVNTITKKVKKDISKMFDVMYTNNGIGLAAPQVGSDHQIFIMDVGEPLVFINPKVIKTSLLLSDFNEGCLSLPGEFGFVSRPRQVIIEATNLNGDIFQYDDNGLGARCVQHEIDHLYGILFIDKVNK